MINIIVGTSKAGNPIKQLPSGAQRIFVGNDGFELKDAGKFTIQIESNNQWNEIENGRVETESEAKECVKSLIADGFCDSASIRYIQI